MIIYAATTRNITVTVRPMYLDASSDLVSRRFAFSYGVTVQNHGDEEVQLLRRRWVIRESNGSFRDQEGDTELRAQPVLAPGDTHAFDGGCTLRSFGGQVEGTYLVRTGAGERFRVEVPAFPLHAAAN
jgi:ApaG protein